MTKVKKLKVLRLLLSSN